MRTKTASGHATARVEHPVPAVLHVSTKLHASRGLPHAGPPPQPEKTSNRNAPESFCAKPIVGEPVPWRRTSGRSGKRTRYQSSWPAAGSWRAAVASEVPAPTVPRSIGAPHDVDAVATQVPEHAIWPLGHETTHAPPEQIWPGPHIAPQPPHDARSLERSRHTPLQLVSPAPQLTVHAPPVHTLPAAHTFPHAPQFRRSVERSRH